MQPTKYPSEVDKSALGVVSDALAAYACAQAVDAAGCAAPLDLIEEHLTDDFTEPQYRRGSHGGRLLENWMFPAEWTGPNGKDENFVLKVQPFSKGGYEATVRQMDLEKIGGAMVADRKKGSREAPDEISIENQIKAAARAKRKMRYLVRNMMADHLVTFTRRETEGSDYWTPEEWASAWDRFRRLLVRYMGKEFPYVAILEQHKKGNYHLHVAWCGRVNVGIVRKMWLSALGGGKGCGNIDARHIKVACKGGDRATRIARYISKYVGKHFEEQPRYNKKRYWSSRQTLEDSRRYVLRALTLDGAISEVRALLGLDWAKFVVDQKTMRVGNVFRFPDGGGMWINYVPELHAVDPPF